VQTNTRMICLDFQTRISDFYQHVDAKPIDPLPAEFDFRYTTHGSAGIKDTETRRHCVWGRKREALTMNNFGRNRETKPPLQLTLPFEEINGYMSGYGTKTEPKGDDHVHEAIKSASLKRERMSRPDDGIGIDRSFTQDCMETSVTPQKRLDYRRLRLTRTSNTRMSRT